jgi:hypothetical protein
MTEYYTREEAEALAGTWWRNTVAYADVPVGTRGQIVGWYNALTAEGPSFGLSIRWWGVPILTVDGFSRRDMGMKPGGQPWPAMVPETDWPAVEAAMERIEQARAETEAAAGASDAEREAAEREEEARQAEHERDLRNSAEAWIEGEHERRNA